MKELIMPREKTFDVDKAVENAMILFWKKGYTDAPTGELLKATGLTKGSFYNAFGSKRDLFIETLNKYDRETHVMLSKLIAMDSPKKAIKAFFDGLFDTAICDPEKKGCFVVNMMLDITSYDDEIQNIVRGCAKSVETFLKQMIELGRVRGEISQDVCPEKTSKLMMGVMVSIRVLGRGTYNKEEIKILAEQGLKLLS
jgi:TetR/AcrR family transcriptional repressor of nem operon